MDVAGEGSRPGWHGMHPRLQAALELTAKISDSFVLLITVFVSNVLMLLLTLRPHVPLTSPSRPPRL